MQFIFIIRQIDGYSEMFKLSCRPLRPVGFISYEALFKKHKKVRNQSSYIILGMIFEEKYYSFYILLTDHSSLPACLYFVRYWAAMYIVRVC